ncbi:flavin-containing monooxygenase [Sporobolomyces salmoneus]|uniref:flavin-containing monooxygenase n=1 Tax=Sporobolomyces salmoneus TaxID=183962 RepID=UPI00317A2C8D
MAATQHHEVIIAGAGISGLTALIQLKRQLGVTDVQVYEKGKELGGTWSTNSYPGATSDIPISFYSLSCSPAKEFNTQWPSSHEILSYWRRIIASHSVTSSITYQSLILTARFSRSTCLWTLEIKDLVSGEIRIETCNVFISAVGALSTPADPPFDTTTFEGRVVHTGKWDPELDLKGKNVVVLGNGCSAAQFVPTVTDQVSKLTQIARSKHSIVPPVPVPDNSFIAFLVRWIPGLFTLFRCAVFFICESYFWMNEDTAKAKKGRLEMKKISDRYIEKTAPEKYWDQLEYDFEFGQKRRIIDFKRYTSSLHSPKLTLLQPDTISSAFGRTITTANGVIIEDVDVVVLSTGFKVTDYLFPLKVYNGEGESLVERLKGNGVKTYLTSMIASYPNFFILMGPNSVTGHSSVLFNTECTVDMMINLLRPVFTALSTSSTTLLVTEKDASSASSTVGDSKLAESLSDEKSSRDLARFAQPTVEVTQAAEDEWYASLREEMGKKIWESKEGGEKVSWYTDADQEGKCTTLYPWGQLHFKKSTQNIVKERFVWNNC